MKCPVCSREYASCWFVRHIFERIRKNCFAHKKFWDERKESLRLSFYGDKTFGELAQEFFVSEDFISNFFQELEGYEERKRRIKSLSQKRIETNERRRKSHEIFYSKNPRTKLSRESRAQITKKLKERVSRGQSNWCEIAPFGLENEPLERVLDRFCSQFLRQIYVIRLRL